MNNNKKRSKVKIVFFILFIILIFIVFECYKVYVLVINKEIFINDLLIDRDNSIIGVDISSHQGNVDMKILKEQGIEFIYIKATEGSSFQDKNFSDNWQNAKNADLLSGAYHFFSYDSSGETQAENYINTVGDLKGRLIPAVDIEYYGDKENNPPKKEDVERELKAFSNIIEKEYGIKPLIYTTCGIYDKYIKGSFNEYKMWIASVYTPIYWNYRDDWYIWQYFNRGELDGYNDEKYIDLNILKKDKNLEDLIVK